MKVTRSCSRPPYSWQGLWSFPLHIYTLQIDSSTAANFGMASRWLKPLRTTLSTTRRSVHPSPLRLSHHRLHSHLPRESSRTHAIRSFSSTVRRLHEPQNDSEQPSSSPPSSTIRTSTASSPPSPTQDAVPPPSSQYQTQPQEARLSLTFTCTVEDCGTRSTHEFTKRSYTRGIVIVQCPGCENR